MYHLAFRETLEQHFALLRSGCQNPAIGTPDGAPHRSGFPRPGDAPLLSDVPQRPARRILPRGNNKPSTAGVKSKVTQRFRCRHLKGAPGERTPGRVGLPAYPVDLGECWIEVGLPGCYRE